MHGPPGYLCVEDADAAMARATAADGTPLVPVADMPEGDRQGGVSDPSGNIWWLSQRLAPGPY
jgi:PhnB protein